MATAIRKHICHVCERAKADCIQLVGATGKWICQACAEQRGQLRLPIEGGKE
jgi:hypothetical protein